jgi:hypothetical protein
MGELTLGLPAVSTAAGAGALAPPTGPLASSSAASLRAPPGLSRPSPPPSGTPLSSILLPGLAAPDNPPAAYAARGTPPRRRRARGGTGVRENPFEDEATATARDYGGGGGGVLSGAGLCDDGPNDDGMMDDPLIEAELRRLVGSVLD